MLIHRVIPESTRDRVLGLVRAGMHQDILLPTQAAALVATVVLLLKLIQPFMRDHVPTTIHAHIPTGIL